MPVITIQMWVKDIIFNPTTQGYEIDLSYGRGKHLAHNVSGYTTPQTATSFALSALATGEHIEIDIDSMTGEITRLKRLSGQMAAPVVAAVNQKYAGVVYFLDAKNINSPKGFVEVRVSSDNPLTTVGCMSHFMYINKNTVITVRPVDLIHGCRLYIEFDTQAILYELRLDSEPAEEVAEIVEKSAPAEWTNLVLPGMMYQCGATDRDHRRSCHFFIVSLARCSDCSSFRESMGDICDCIEAHKHYETYGRTITTNTNNKIQESASYDELMQEQFGRKL